MTTQNTHPEHGDVEESVVTYQSVSDTETGAETSSPPPVLETAAPTQTNEAPADEPTGEKEAPSSTGSHEDPKDSQEPFATKDTQEAREIGAETADVSSFSFNAGPTSANVLASEEEVRPFTDFIAEFQQAATRFGSPQQNYPTDSSAASEPARFQNDETRTATPAESNEPKAETAAPAERPVSPLLRPATPRQRASRHSGNRHREETSVEKSEQAQSAATPTPAEATPVVTEPAPSQADQAEEQPRPARRYRFDRPAASATNGPTVTGPTSTPPVQSRLEENKDVSGRGSSALPVRPENGYTSNGQNGEKEVQPLQQTKQAANVAQTPENPTAKQPDVQEAPIAGNSTESTTPVAPDNERRRRHGQERQRAKAQAAPAKPATTPTAMAVVPAAEIVIVVPDSAVPAKEETNSEDLPPLEYSELQKASTRRRRRRHSSGSTNTVAATGATSLPAAVKAVTPEVPAALAPIPTPIPTPAPIPTAVPSIAVPRTPAPAQPVAAANQYTITSGHTVNQMNQSRDGSNAFMGPDPSPARGSIAAQNVRTIRTDVQRTPSYPVRTTEATSASVQQLANVVSQAIQTQTDRMVAELRRANQSPTNVSVSMPPFPSTERVGVFVDVANLLYSARTLRMTVDFGKLLDFLRGNRRLIRAQAYCPTSPQVGDEQMFLQAVKGLGYRITTKNYKTFSSGAKKADLDLDLCMDVVRLVDGGAVDCIVLVSGDSDFMPMLDYCSDHGVRVEVAAFDEAMSATLRQSCDLFINLSMLEEIRA